MSDDPEDEGVDELRQSLTARNAVGVSSEKTGAKLNEQWGVGAAHALYIHDGHWYHRLRRFPGALVDANGYVLFQTEDEYRKCAALSIGKQISVRKPGISAIPGYVRVLGSPAGIRRSPISPPEEVSGEPGSFSEGTAVEIKVNRYERDARARARCIAHYGARCCACGLEFGNVYGPGVAGFIHVHHLTPLASVGRRYRVDPVRDLRPICPNCHAVVHRREPPYSIEELQIMLVKAKGR